MLRACTLLAVLTLPWLAGCSCGTPEGIPLPAPPPPTPPAELPLLVKVSAPDTVADAQVTVEAEGCTPGPRGEGAVLRDVDGGLADAIVWHRRGPQSQAPPPPPAVTAASTHSITITDCAITPRAIAARQGDELVLGNGDDRYHTVHLWRVDGGQERSLQTIALAPKEETVRFPLAQPGLYRLRSDQLPWMRGLLLVAGPGEHGGVTGTDGYAGFDLPDGSWDVRLVHETLGSVDTSAEVGAGATASVYGTLPAE